MLAALSRSESIDDKYFNKRIEWSNYCKDIWASIENKNFFMSKEHEPFIKEFGGSIV